MTRFPTDALRAHIAGRFASAAVEPFPLPHVTVPDFFPAPVYADLLRLNPFANNRGREWISSDKMKRTRQPTPYDLRRQIDFEHDEFAATPEMQQFWDGILEALLGGDWFAKLAYGIYPAYFDLRFGDAVLDPGFFARLDRGIFVQRHEPGYHIGPHTDSPHRVFTCIFALAEGSGFEQYGTQFVRPRDPDVRCWGDLHHDPADFEVVEVAPYTPNSAVLFFKTRHSFHSVRTIDTEIPNQRYGMQLGYYEPASGLFRDLSRPDLMEKRTTKPLLDARVLGHSIVVR